MNSYKIASNSKRFINWLVDSISISILWLILLPVIVVILKKAGLFDNLKNGETMDLEFTVLPIAFLYYLTFESIFKTTLGKLITRTKIIRQDNEEVNFVDILLRTLCRFIPFEQLSFLAEKPAGWHDKISETRIITKS
ncbi:MAG: RDD family protein [Labilibaculum sp.]|nr:RDD family protein [Labilibaculum sp.]MBI9060103.1 RDD family protein [Labilibaculum sp.]